jgi:hypothetical protein
MFGILAALVVLPFVAISRQNTKEPQIGAGDQRKAYKMRDVKLFQILIGSALAPRGLGSERLRIDYGCTTRPATWSRVAWS